MGAWEGANTRFGRRIPAGTKPLNERSVPKSHGRHPGGGIHFDFHGAKSRFDEKMTKSEYQELAEFLGDQFRKVHQRLDAVERRLDAVDQRLDAVERRLTRVEVLGEQDRGRMRILAEGIAHVTESLDAFRQEVSTEFAAVRSEMVVGLTAVRAEMAEGFVAVRSEMQVGFAAVRAEMADGFAEVHSEMAEGFAEVRSEMDQGFTAQTVLVEGLGGRVSRLESRWA